MGGREGRWACLGGPREGESVHGWERGRGKVGEWKEVGTNDVRNKGMRERGMKVTRDRGKV